MRFLFSECENWRVENVGAQDKDTLSGLQTAIFSVHLQSFILPPLRPGENHRRVERIIRTES